MMNSTIDVNIIYVPKVNYAMVSNGVRCIREISLTNNGTKTLRDLVLTISGEMVVKETYAISVIKPGTTVKIDDLDLQLSLEDIVHNTERLLTRFKVEISMPDEEPLAKEYDLSILAFDEWPGIEEMPEISAAFVTPNASKIPLVLRKAAVFLKSITGDESLNSFLYEDPYRIRAEVAAIFAALRTEGIVYSSPPASFFKGGQRVRMADKVLAEKMGTCIDTSLLLCSCLEAVNLDPILIFFENHAAVGVWLTFNHDNPAVCDDSSLLLKESADGINRLVFVESTYISSIHGKSFEDAATYAENEIRKGEWKFECFVDIKKCRLNNILPMPVILSDGKWVIDQAALKRKVDKKHVRKLTTSDIPSPEEYAKLSRLQIWERKLLDISLRNSLVNMRMSQRVIPFVSLNIEGLEDKMQEKQDFSIETFPLPPEFQLHPDDTGLYDSSLFRETMEDMVNDGIKRGAMISYLTEPKLTATLKSLYRASRTSYEENGANSLFLALGLLKWYEDDKSQLPRYAPLLLLPVDLIRKSINNYVLRSRDDDPILNTTLVEMLKQQFDINIDVNPLPTDEHGIDVRAVLSIVRNEIKKFKRWDVFDESILGLFSFNKFVMWNDIHSNAETICKHPIVSSLIEKKLTFDPNMGDSKETDARKIDNDHQPEDFAIVTDADSSQMEAIVDSGLGHSFIMYGPPGTGKSQTITNMIANALYHDKRVLFVAEKMAALSVVEQRLKKVGLEPFCLELHSSKATKSHLLGQLDMALNVAHIESPEDFEKASKELFAQRKQLLRYMESLHRKDANGFSLYDCITRYLALNADRIQISADIVNDMSVQKLQHVMELLESLDVIFKITGHPADSSLRGISINDPSFAGSESFKATIEAMKTALPKARTAMKKLAAKYGLPSDWTISNMRFMAEVLNAWINLTKEEYEYDIFHKNIASEYTEGIFSLDPEQLKAALQEARAKNFISRAFANRKILSGLRKYNSRMKFSTIPDLISKLERNSDIAAKLDADATALESTSHIDKAQIKKGDNTLEDARNQVNVFLEVLDSNAGTFTLDFDSLDELSSRLEGYSQSSGSTRDWYHWSVRKKEIKEAGAQSAIDYILKNHKTGPEASRAFQKEIFRQIAMRRIDEDPDLRQFMGLLFEEQIRKYRELSRQFQELTKKALYYHLASKIPSLTIEAANSSEIGILRRYITSHGRGASIRAIIDKIPTLLPKLCPCMLMSPLSVAQYLDLKHEEFDLVIFDEASQMPTSEAVGTIARGKALVVAGDPKQMPPTTFFMSNSIEEEYADNADMESILDDAITLSLPSHYLSWHYRSKHESLITFSNQEYYGGRLNTFPSVDDRVSKVTLRHIEGTYDHGGTRCNKAEAKAISEEVVRRLRLPEGQRQSIGIVAFSKVQQDLIEDVLNDMLAKDKNLESLAYDSEEPIFIKNLENVQGDERDVILFSVGYGPDKRGKVSMNFGPLNQNGGERRLNVAVSRARYEMMVFSTLRSQQIDLRRSQAKGVVGLKNFLEFAERGVLDQKASQIIAAEPSEIVSEIAEELGKKGYKTDTSVGRSRFKIDLAVIDPKDDKNYLLGILTDGEGYYETKTERDREICQPSILKMLGWNLMRVWTIDWFENRNAVINRIVEVLKDLEDGKAVENMPEPSVEPFDPAYVEPVAAVNGHAMEYSRMPDPKVAKQGDLEYVLAHPKTVSSQMKKIISAEQPVTFGYLCRRISHIWGLSRVSPRLQDLVSGLLKPYHITKEDPDSPTVWLDAKTAKGYDKYRTDSGRDVNDLPLVEIMNAMKYAVEQQLRLSADDLVQQVRGMLGFARMGSKVQVQMNKALDLLVRRKELTLKDGNVTVKN